MRIVDRATFLALPSGVLFAKYSSLGNFDNLLVKQDTMFDFNNNPTDFGYQNVMEILSSGSDEWIDIISKAEKTSESFSLDLDCGSRDGLFDQDQMFAVYEQQDLDETIKLLRSCKAAKITGSKEDPKGLHVLDNEDQDNLWMPLTENEARIKAKDMMPEARFLTCENMLWHAWEYEPDLERTGFGKPYFRLNAGNVVALNPRKEHKPLKIKLCAEEI